MCKNTNHTHESILKFDNFLLESKIAKLLLEGNLMASDKFLTRLSGINNNHIAIDLLKAFSDKTFIDKDLPQNWVDITDKEDTVSFMADRGANKIMHAGGDPELIFTSKSRNEVKVGRFARAILTELGKTVSDKDIENFVNIYKSSKVDTSKKFELVSGPLIKKYYLYSNYSKNTGSLGGSCMRGSDCQRYFKIYTKNPEACQLLIYLDEQGKVLGRALVWKIFKKELYKTPDQTKFECESEYFMDRVYTANDSDVIKFINYAKEKGWIYKQKMTSDERLGLIFKYGDQIIFGKLIVKLHRLHFSKYPFVDTLSFSDGDSMISNVGFTIDDDDDDADEGFIMCDTEGDHEPCSNCDGTGYDDDDGTECKKCDGDGEVVCTICRGGGNIICTKCDGGGDIKCITCDGDGDVSCTDCNGEGDINCADCDGNGHKECNTCHGEGDMGECKACDGHSYVTCTDCKGEPITCTGCKGVGEIVRKWGKGTRRVKCPDCGGARKTTSGEIGKEGCRCKSCSIIGWNRTTWTNRLEVSCKQCDGEGVILCKTCKDEDDAGQIECRTCKGQGAKRCTKCNWGSIECKDCDGSGSKGECKDCKGSGKLGKCKTCKSGQVKCDVCNGTGDRPKGSDKELCPECAGLLDELKKDLSTNKYRIL